MLIFVDMGGGVIAEKIADYVYMGVIEFDLFCFKSGISLIFSSKMFGVFSYICIYDQY